MNMTMPLDSFWPDALIGIQGPLDAAWLLFTAALWLLSSVYAAGSIRGPVFWTLWLVSMAGNLLLIVSQDALSFYIGFSMMSLAAYGLVVHDRTPVARRAGRIYLQLAVLGEMALLSGLIMISYQLGGAVQFAAWQGSDINPLPAALVLAGLGLKAGFWPLHVWLPLAHPAAPAPASAVLSGVMIKAGILGLWKILPAASLMQQWAIPVMSVAVFSAFYGALMGLTRSNVKQLLAFSSISQIGFLLFLVGLSWHLPGQRSEIAVILMLYGVHHGLAKGTLFLAADLFKHRSPTAWLQALLAVLLLATALSIAGLPLTSGAAVKSELKSALATDELAIWRNLIIAGSITSALIMIKALVLFRRLSSHSNAEPDTAPPGIRKLSAWIVLASCPAVLPWLWPSMRESILYSLSASNLWALCWPLGIAMVMYALGSRLPFEADRMGRWLPNLMVPMSLRLKRTLGRLTQETPDWQFDTRSLRNMERRWNRLWHGSTVNLSSTLLVIITVLTIVLLST